MLTQYRELIKKYKFKSLTNHRFHLIYLKTEGYISTGFDGIWYRKGKRYEIRFVGDNLEIVSCK